MERQAKDGTIYQQVGDDSWTPVTRQAKDGTVYKKVGADSWSPMDAPKPAEDSGGILGTIAKVGKAIDSYTGAPTRAAIGAAQNGNNPIPAFTGQFGQDPDKAPTGHDLALKAGLSDNHPLVMTADQMRAWDAQNKLSGPSMVQGPYKDKTSWSPADVGGAALTVAADPTNLIPVIGESKLAKPLVSGAGELISKGAESASRALEGMADTARIKATGATGSQAAKFADNAGRELKPYVKFGDTQAKIADRVSQGVAAAESKIDEALRALDAQGVVVDTKKVRQALVDRVRDMAGKASEQDILKAVNGEIQNIKDAAEVRGSTTQAISEAEQEKRGFNRKAKNWQNPDVGQAGKEAYLAYRDEVENAARAADPKTAALFEEGKKAYGLLDPIEEAAQKRALTAQQASPVSLKDLAALKVGGIPAFIANKVLTPRLASSAAVTMDSVASALRKLPELSAIESKNPVAFNKIVEMISQHSSPSLKAADNAPTKGPDKWANDGLQKLIEHAGPDVSALSKIQGPIKDDDLKELLIRASDLKPGSKAMDKLMEKVKSKIASDE